MVTMTEPRNAGGSPFLAIVIIAIALQNIPEGTSVAIPMDEAGFGFREPPASAPEAMPGA